MFEGTTCTAMRRGGRDCNAPVMEDAPVTLCQHHMRKAYLFYADLLVTLQLESPEARGDAERMGRTDLSEKPAAVYYVRIGHFIKIGVSRAVHTRMIQLQPDEILAFEPGDRQVEQARHAEFAWCRAPKGKEYFLPVQELMDHVARLRGVGWSPLGASLQSLDLRA